MWPQRLVQLTGYNMNAIDEPLTALNRLVHIELSYCNLLGWYGNSIL